MSVLLIRTVVVYIMVVFALRVMGKRQLGELQPSELVVTILVSNIATLSIEDTSVPLLGSILPVFILVSCEYIVSVLTLKSTMARKLISGNPRIVIREGQVDQKEMKNLRWSIEDLMEQLHIGGIFDISEVALAIVETSGTLTAYPKFSARPVTAEVMNIPQGTYLDTPPMVVISDGYIIEDALNYCNTDVDWLHTVLHQKHLKPKDVFLMSCDRNKEYTIVRKNSGGLKGQEEVGA